MQDAIVKWYDPQKAFGFVTVDGEQDMFVHRSVLPRERDYLVAGEEVRVEAVQGRKGLEVGSILILDPSLPSPRPTAPRPVPSRRPLPDTGEVPRAPVSATVCSIDSQRRFIFVKLADRRDVYVHCSLLDECGYRPRLGDSLEVSVEQTDRGLRAVSLRPR